MTGCCPDGAFLCSDLGEMVCRPVGNCRLLRAGCWRAVCTGSCKTSSKVKLVRDPSCAVDAYRRTDGGVQGRTSAQRRCRCWRPRMCGRFARQLLRAAVSALVTMRCTAVANCRCVCGGCYRSAFIDRCKTDVNVKPVRESHCVVDLHRRAQGAVQGCAADARKLRHCGDARMHV